MSIAASMFLAVALWAGVAQAAGPDDSQIEAAPAPALAPPWRLPAGERATAQVEQRSWYGYQLIVSDAISVGLVAASFYQCPLVFILPVVASAAPRCSAAADLGYAGVASFALTPAIIHAAHGRFGAAGGSLALRIALPLVLGLAFPPAAPVAVLAGAFIDDAFLSYEPRPSLEEPSEVPADAWPPSRDH